MLRVVMSYDVTDDRRRTRVCKLLQRHGERVQYSVFEAWIEPEQLDRLEIRARALLDPETDDLRIYVICAACQRRTRRVGRSEEALKRAG